jgi:hypothetical protein
MEGFTAALPILSVPQAGKRVDTMRKLALAAGLVALATATPAVADGKGSGASASRGHSQASTVSADSMRHFMSRLWQPAFLRPAFGTPPGFFSPGRHYGWFRGKHWGWFKKPKNPHWPHDPPVSP